MLLYSVTGRERKVKTSGDGKIKICDLHRYILCYLLRVWPSICSYWSFNPYPTAFPYGNGMVLHFYQQQESSTTKTVHKVINKGLKAYV